MSATSEVIERIPSRTTDSVIRNTLTAIAIVALCAGVLLRFYALGAHGFWADEGVSALHAAGYTRADVLQVYRHSGTLTAQQLRSFEVAGSSTTAGRTIRALASEDSQHPPL